MSKEIDVNLCIVNGLNSLGLSPPPGILKAVRDRDVEIVICGKLPSVEYAGDHPKVIVFLKESSQEHDWWFVEPGETYYPGMPSAPEQT